MDADVEHAQSTVEVINNDHLCVQQYMENCERLLTAPCIRFINRLMSSSIDLSYQSLGSDGIKAICLALYSNVFVKELSLRGNRIDDRVAMDLGRLLKVNACIKMLDLSENQLEDESFKELGEGLEENNVLTVLNLSDNKPSRRGVTNFIQSLASNSALKTLKLANNNIEDNTLENLPTVLMDNCSLENLDLAWNKLTSNMGSGSVIKADVGLKSLNISWNGLKDKGFSQLTACITCYENQLTCLDVSNNKISSQSRKQVFRLIQQGKVTKLNLTGNCIDNELKEELQKQARISQCEMELLL